MTTIKIKDKEFTVSSCSESEVWKVIGKQLSGMPCPSDNIEVKVDNLYTGYFKVAKRGTWTDDDGKIHPSRYITMTGGNLTRIPYTSPSNYPSCYLACIHPQSNNYKAYYLEQRLADGRIIARYESIDKFLEGKYREVKDPYPSYLYWVRYYEKISKGYIDQSEIYFNKTATQSAPKTPVTASPTNASEELYALLYNYALKRVEKSLTSVHVTVKQVKTARKILKKLGSFKTVRAFNKHLQELLVLSPRKRDPLHDDVADFLARDKSDMARIISREEDLLKAMEALVGEPTKVSTPKNSFKAFGIEVFEANDKQRKEVLNLLGTSSLTGKIGRIWRVKPLKQEKKFAEYCKRRGIKEIRKFWHGSRNENWASILENSLSLTPNAIITGKMFGDGIYFAPSPSKSFNYTSFRGTSWARGTSNRGFMGIFATAYGTPNMVKTWGGDYSNGCRTGRYDCVHATAGNTGLRADEVVFYDEDAICLNYLVEFC